MKYPILLVIVAVLFGCVSQTEHEKLKQELALLKYNYDQCANGADRTVAEIRLALEGNDFLLAKSKILTLANNHPEANENKEFAELLPQLEKDIAEEKQRIIEAEEEKKRLANLNNTGVWRIVNYVDEFGEQTDEAVLTLQLFSGRFSNSATQDSELHVRFLIDGSTKSSIKLFEYGRNNPVKSYGEDLYKVMIQDKEGVRKTVNAMNWSDRLQLRGTNAKSMHNALMKGGLIKFSIYEVDTPTNKYYFEIENADYYDNAFRKLKEK